jgi:hypothetical protein
MTSAAPTVLAEVRQYAELTAALREIADAVTSQPQTTSLDPVA